MIKNIAKRFLAFMLAILMVFSLFPASPLTVSAAGGTLLEGLAEGIGADYTGTGTYEWVTVGTDGINGSATGKKGTCSSSSATTTLTITNNKANEAKLSFDYTLALNGGTITIDGTNVTANGTFEKEMAQGASISIVLTSAKAASSTTISISNLLMLVAVNATTTFQPAENGSYSVDGTEITEELVKTQSSTIPYSLKATPVEGYKFSGWYSVTDNKYLSSDIEATFNFEKNQTVTAKFVPAEAPVFEVDSARFTDLNEANTYAVANSIDKITLISDGTLSAGDYTIASGVTLLIPFDEAGTCYTTAPAPVGGNNAGGWTYSTPSAFRTLTMAEDSSINVNGSLSVSAQHAHSQELMAGGAPTGPCGFIRMEKNSTITVNSGGATYVYGFIIGEGTVTAKSGAIVYENFQIADFRGGSATLAMNNKGVFPFSQYYVQNIEVPLTLESGAEEYVYTSLYASSKPNSTSIKFIGSTGAMFIPDTDTTVTKQYLPDQDRLEISVNGNLSVSNLSLNVGGASVNSKDYVLPINNNITINVQSGITTINQKLALLAGAELNIAEGAELNVASGIELFVYDRTEWIENNYVRDSWKFTAVKHSPTRSCTRTNEDLINAKMDINGTLTMNGAVYTTKSGADVISSNGTGKVNFISNPGTAVKTQQVTQSGSSVTFIDIPVNSIWLHNGGANVGSKNEYTTTKEAENGWVYCYNTETETWETQNTPTTITVTFDANGGEGIMEPQTITSRGNLTKNTFTNGDYVFGGWNTAADGIGDSYADEEVVNLREDTTLYAVWLHTVTWANWDGTVLKTENLKDGSMPAYTGTPRKNQDAQYSYKFVGWDPEIKPVDGNITYTAVFEATLRTYSVFWKNGTTTLETDTQVPYGTIPTYDGATPTKAADANGEYIFTGWSPEVGPITGSTTYTAQFKQKTNGYTVTWTNDDGTVLETDEQVPEGTVPTYDGAEPTKEADAQYTYTFAGWEPEVAAVTADVTYKATYSKTVNSYTITWVNEDGTVLGTEEVAYGEFPVYLGETPVKESDPQYIYTFAGWDKEISAVTKEETYTAVYTKELQTYTVTWTNDDGIILETDKEVPYGTIPSYDSETPEKAADEHCTYTFAGWTPEISEVVGDVTYIAEFDAHGEIHTVTFEANGGEGTMEIQSHEYGVEELLTSNAFTKDGYKFLGWNTKADGTGEDYADQGSIRFLTEDITLYAKWQFWNGWFNDENGTTYIVDGEKAYNDTWAVIEEKTYYFDESGYVVKGIYETMAQDNSHMAMFVFDTITGEFLSSQNGLFDVDAETYWIENGEVVKYAGLVRIVKDDGEVNYYYFDEDNKAVKATEETNHYIVAKNNGLALPEGNSYIFDENGVIVHFDSSINGIYLDETSSEYYYCVDGVIIADGLMEIDGYYYYARTSTGAFVRNCNYWITRTHGLLEEGTYTFDDMGKIVFPEETEKKNGIVEENGSLYYYVAGEICGAGLIQLDGDYYYVRTSTGEVIHDRSYWVTTTNDLLPSGQYTFASDGKMIDPPEIPVEPEIKNGIVAEDGSLYYYVDGARTGAGLIQLDGDYYYVRTSNGEVIHGRKYWITATNDLLPAGQYVFDDNGKMIVE